MEEEANNQEWIQFLLVILITTVFFFAFHEWGKWETMWSTLFSGSSSALIIVFPFLWKKLGRSRKGVKALQKRKGDMVKHIRKSVESSSSISMAGINLQDILGDYHFRQALKKNSGESKRKLRVCMLYPSLSNDFLKIRMKDELFGENYIMQKDDESSTMNIGYGYEGGAYQHKLQYTIDKIEAATRQLAELQNKKICDIELRYLNKTYLLNSIIILESEMLIVDYLHRRGSECPMIILNKKSEAWQSYNDEFEILWRLADKYDFSQIDQKSEVNQDYPLAKELFNQQTGWIKWEKVKIYVDVGNRLTCEVAAENLTENRATCLVYVQLRNKTIDKYVFKFYLESKKNEIVNLNQVLNKEYSEIYSIEVDEE
ncbi:MAG: hypothetical protein WCZ90_07815 [Melioribacteraceae bacterium]